MAEGQGFEPWVPLDTPVFKTGAFNRSATPPVTFFVWLRVQETAKFTSGWPRKSAADYTADSFPYKAEPAGFCLCSKA